MAVVAVRDAVAVLVGAAVFMTVRDCLAAFVAMKDILKLGRTAVFAWERCEV